MRLRLGRTALTAVRRLRTVRARLEVRLADRAGHARTLGRVLVLRG